MKSLTRRPHTSFWFLSLKVDLSAILTSNFPVVKTLTALIDFSCFHRE